MRKLNTKWSAPGGLDPHRGCAGSPSAPHRWPGRNRAAKKLIIVGALSREWLGEWAGSGAVIGEPSLSLGGSVSLTLVPSGSLQVISAARNSDLARNTISEARTRFRLDLTRVCSLAPQLALGGL